MVRITNTRAALSSDRDLPKHRSWQALSAVEIDRFIRQSRRALRSHRRDARSADVSTAETALAAVETTRALLRELLGVVAPEKRQEIQMILDRE